MGDGPAECNIKVICRVRPLNDSEEKAGSKFILKFPTDDSISVAGKVFLFDKVFKPDAIQENVYNTVAKPIVKDVLSGYNGTIFAYGQTASGKTHTMEGVLNNASLQGIIPRIVGDIFSYIYQMDENVEFHIKVSYFEIYMDKIRDLLDINKVNLLVHEDKNRVPYVKGATERFVSSPEEVLEVIDEGKANRHVAVTNMNEHSSRSHSVFLINVKQENLSTEKKLSGKLYLVDLAGSEKVSKTGAEGSVLDEAKNINKSLSALGNVIAALADCAPFIPYRDSKLTRILQESLGGNARTTMVICCSPASYNETETKSTLMFGQRAKTIKNSVMINEELTAEEWKRRYEKERDKNARLRGIIEKYELELNRWRTGDTVPESERVSTKDIVETGQIASPDLSRPNIAISTSAGASNEERQRWEEEKMNLYQQLDDKDEEISAQATECDKFKEQLSIAEEQISGLVRDRDNALAESIRLQSDYDSSTKEVKEVLQALEELAQNYDQKKGELEGKEKENETLLEDLNKKIHSVQELEKELQQSKELLSQQRKKASEQLNNLLKELTDFMEIFAMNLESPKQDDDGASIHMFLFKLKSEAKIMYQKCNQLETEKIDSAQKHEELLNDLSNNKLLLQQQEAKIKTMSETTKDIDSRKRQLEEEVDKLNNECAELTAKEQLYMAQLTEKEKAEDAVASALSMKSALELQMEAHREQHQKQLHELRIQISERDDKINMLNETAEAHKVALERIHSDFDLLKQQDLEKTNKLKDITDRLEREQMASNDLKNLEDKVSREMQTLHNLRKLFTQNLLDSVKKTSMITSDEDDTGGSIVQKQRIQFLENNLDQLTKVHKQLVRDNADLRCELPKLERRLKATMERIKALETALREAKEGAIRDRKRYQQEVEHIKEVVRQKTLLKRGNSATIAKPIRAGHAPVSTKADTQHPHA